MNTKSGNPVISLKGVSKWYDDFQALKDINLTINLKEKIVICGPSGSGKSTLIRCLNRLEAHQEGEIHVSGIELHETMKDVDIVRRDIGMVFQNFNLFWHMNLIENIIEAPIRVLKIEKNKINEILSLSLSKTKDMKAQVGRAKFLEKKGLGFIDPGAQSTEIILREYFEAIL